jgi:leucyl-tRNA synthetase
MYMQRYNPKQIEPKWQAQWAVDKLYAAVDFSDKPKYVMLTEFPYPSGSGIHLGHAREYTYGDIMARHKRMQGYNVLFPMGYDAFGLPTENYAIKNKVSPQKATDDNVATFQSQLEALGYSFDWDRSFRTSDPDYYKWTQWLFLQFFEKGLAYQDEISINWCPFEKTGLANEEVINGRHERCGTEVEKKFLKQWLLRITDYADRLIDGLKTVDYPSRIADQQINWIGRSKGAEISFQIQDSKQAIEVFTTRADTIFGATFLVLAPEHPLVNVITNADHKGAVDSYIKSTQAKSDVERQDTDRPKTGVATGAHAVNPATGQPIPIWIADYVLSGYGTGAVMAVPAHDERDNEFAKKFNLPIVRVVKNKAADDDCSHDDGTMMNSGDYDGISSQDMRDKIIDDLEKQGIAKAHINYRLRDWIFSRQHYWGEPIPIIHCPEHGAVAVPTDQLPVTLPEVEHYEPTDTGESPLAAIADWVNTTCPTCGKPAKRETDTMPNWAGSSWYYLRYYDAHNDQAFADPKKLNYWGEVDVYLGGMEHTTLHLLYSRFWHEFLYDQKLVPTPEPYAARRGQGIILATDGTKMSKSKGNIVNPTDIIDSGYGADSLRLSIAFLAPYDQTTPWGPEGVAGTFRFLQRLWALVGEHLAAAKTESTDASELHRIVHTAIKAVSKDLDDMSFNTSIASLMDTMNKLYKLKLGLPLGSPQWQEALVQITQLVAPFAPHIAEELWTQLGQDGSVHISAWPSFNDKYLANDTVTIAVQVNGKVRGQILIPSGADEETAIEIAKQDENVATHLSGKNIVKTIYVAGRVLNFVITD